MKRVLLTGIAVLMLTLIAGVALVGSAGIYGYRRMQAPGPLAGPAVVVIPHGSRTSDIGRRLEASGVISHWWLFKAGVQIFDPGGPLHAGEYAFVAGQSIDAVLRQLREGRTVVHRLTVPEGLTVAEIMALVNADPALSGEAGPTPPEGTLMPDTYNFALADLRSEMVARMRRAMDKILADAWANRAPGSPLPSPDSALILASIVEKESAIPEERPKVAAVFLNRIRSGMRLQADPTVIYALTGGKAALGRPLAHADLAIDSPYNSYRYDGLPPTPIACPGRGSLTAVLHPAEIRALYFVADGTGRHVFAESLDDHNRNVTRLRQLEHGAPGAAAGSGN